ncbi:TetR family transcriptional regulator [Rhodobacter capsulatus]|uniref:TetR family transcriptional regulator n=1 Tax=Rhodobacter capsulatus TaxID=1061 RepID=UPI0003D2E3E3|nr:TetR family transcriptional regulator [Rhodobacter capsulatus]ETD89872.1 transcriptional regulator [Rhodobacter capsulatus YW2]
MRRSKADAEQTRQNILDAAERLFCTRGIAQTTLEQIAREAGATRGAIYWHFKDKNDVLSGIYERYEDPQLCRIETAAAGELPDDPLDVLEVTGAEYLQTIESDPVQQRLHLILISGTPNDGAEQWRESKNAEIYRLLLRLMERAHAEGSLSDALTPQEAAVAQMVMFNGLIGEWHRSGRAFPLHATGSKLVRHLIDSMRRKPAAEGTGA